MERRFLRLGLALLSTECGVSDMERAWVKPERRLLNPKATSTRAECRWRKCEAGSTEVEEGRRNAKAWSTRLESRILSAERRRAKSESVFLRSESSFPRAVTL